MCHPPRNDAAPRGLMQALALVLGNLRKRISVTQGFNQGVYMQTLKTTMVNLIKCKRCIRISYLRGSPRGIIDVLLLLQRKITSVKR
jgi:hypothetical protein